MRKLPFDFYIPEFNMCIEYDGEQHFKAVDYFGGEDGLKIRQIHDRIKTDYCNSNNILLLRIRYDENIEEKLHSFIH
jgi:very-short-patch-repair endonuclease